MTAGNNHFGKLDAFFHSPRVAGEARVKTCKHFPVLGCGVPGTGDERKFKARHENWDMSHSPLRLRGQMSERRSQSWERGLNPSRACLTRLPWNTSKLASFESMGPASRSFFSLPIDRRGEWGMTRG